MVARSQATMIPSDLDPRNICSYLRYSSAFNIGELGGSGDEAKPGTK